MFRKCKGNHWKVESGKLILETPTEKHLDLTRKMVKTLEAQIRQEIVKDIMAWKPVQNRKQIMKAAGSLDNALLGVQAICADIAQGKQDE